MRAPGDPQSMFASECHVDMIAQALSLDPIELRRRNALRDGQPSVTGERVHRARAVDVLDALERESNWSNPLAPGHGRGVALGVRHIGAGATSILMRLVDGGEVEVVTGVSDQGGGVYTVLRRVAAAVMSVDPRRVIIRHTDTSGPAPDPGVGGQRITHVQGRAAQSGAVEMKARLEELAAEAMGWPAGEVHLDNDRFVGGDSSASFEEVAEATNPASRATSSSLATLSRLLSTARPARWASTTSCSWRMSARSSIRSPTRASWTAD